MCPRTGSRSLRASSGSRSASSSIELLRSANRTVTCLRSPSSAAFDVRISRRGVWGCKPRERATDLRRCCQLPRLGRIGGRNGLRQAVLFGMRCNIAKYPMSARQDSAWSRESRRDTDTRRLGSVLMLICGELEPQRSHWWRASFTAYEFRRSTNTCPTAGQLCASTSVDTRWKSRLGRHHHDKYLERDDESWNSLTGVSRWGHHLGSRTSLRSLLIRD